jgi:hypothetical protein
MAVTAGLAEEGKTMLKRAYAALAAALAAAGIFCGNAAHAQTLPNIVILEPSASHLVYDVVTVSADATSPSPIVSVTAAVDGRSVSLVMLVCTPRGTPPCPVGWRGDLDIAGLPRGNLTLAVTATDAMGHVGTTTMTIVHGPLRLTDLDGDGKSDLLYRNASTGLIYRLLMDGLSIKDTAFAYYEPDPDWHVVADADFDGDGVSDLLWRNASAVSCTCSSSTRPACRRRLGLLDRTEPRVANHRDARLRRRRQGRHPVAKQRYARALCDAHGRRQDRRTTQPRSTVGDLRPHDPPGSRRLRGPRHTQRYSLAGSIRWVRLSHGDHRVLERHVPGAFAVSQPIYTEPDQNWGIVAAADFDGDGKSDILWRNNRTGEVWMMLMDGGSIASRA